MTERHTKKPGVPVALPTVYADGLEELGSLPVRNDEPKVIRPGEVRMWAPRYIGAWPVRSELKILPEVPGPSLGQKEWARHGNCAVCALAMGPLDHSWTLAEGGTVLIRAQGGGWYLLDLKKDEQGWFVTCIETRVPIVWDDTRQVWVSTVPV